MNNGDNVRIRAEICKTSLQSLYDFLISNSCPDPKIVMSSSTALVNIRYLIKHLDFLESESSK